MNLKQAQTSPAYFDQDDQFDSQDAHYEHQQEAAEATLRMDMCHRTPARFDNDSWSH